MNKHCVNFHDASQGLILVLTKNNDHQTLSEILQMREATSHRLENIEESENPMVEASLADDIKCMRVLHKAGYRVRLANEDWKAVKINVPVTKFSISCEEKEEKDKTVEEDPVIRFLRFKAFSNPLYLSLELAAERGPGTDNPRKVSIDNFVLRDPIKRAFALSQHAKLLAGYFSEHSVEYMEIRAQLKC